MGATYFCQFMWYANCMNLLFSKLRGGNSKFLCIFANAELAFLNY